MRSVLVDLHHMKRESTQQPQGENDPKLMRSGSQPRVPYVWRTMRKDMDDLRLINNAVHGVGRDDDKMRSLVVQAVGYGSQERSPFLHACASHSAALRWYCMAGTREPQHELTMVRMDVQACGEGNLIDVSSDASLHKFFVKGLQGYGDFVRSNFYKMNMATDYKECLLMWRGALPLDAFDVVDPYVGTSIGKLKDFLADGSQPSVPALPSVHFVLPALPSVPAPQSGDPQCSRPERAPPGAPTTSIGITSKAPPEPATSPTLTAGIKVSLLSC